MTRLTGHLMPDFKTIADFRKDNGEAIRLKEKIAKLREEIERPKGRKMP
jgi:hypothetical protein